MTYWQFVSRRVPGTNVEDLFEQFEDNERNDKIINLKDSLQFFNAVTRYTEHLERNGLIFKNIYFRNKKRPLFDKGKIKEIYYGFNGNYHLRDGIEVIKESLINSLNRRIEPEAKKAWVGKTIESLDQRQLNKLHDRPDQEFESSAKEEHFLAHKIVVRQSEQVSHKIHQNRFLSTRAQYLRFLRTVPELIDLSKWDISQEEWEAHIGSVRDRFRNDKIKMADISPYLYLYDLVVGRKTDYEIRYALIDEIQDYAPFQLAYPKYNFPRTKSTMLGDLNQATFTKDEGKALLSQISKLFDPEKTNVVQLTKSYRSTKKSTGFTKQILRQGEKIGTFDRHGPKPAFYKRDGLEKEFNTLEDILVGNGEQRLTIAITAETLAETQEVTKVLEEGKIKATSIGSANQRLVPGTLAMPSYLAKGLEFGAVIAWNVSRDNYRQLDETQLLYTIASRVMYKLDLIYTGEKSPLFDDLDERTYMDK